MADALGSEQFMNLFLAQMKHQDPMEPMSNTEMMTQMSQLATLEATNSLRSNFSDMLRLQQMENASSLVGREVVFSGEEGVEQDTVEAVRTTDERIRLVVGDRKLALSEIMQVF
jgi:flagellar basal-body rod modification protein FlgD